MQFALGRAAVNLQAATELLGNSRLCWLRFGLDFFCYGVEDAFAEFAQRAVGTLSFHSLAVPAGIQDQHLYLVVQEDSLFRRAHPEVPVLLDKGRHMLVLVDPRQAEHIAPHQARFSLRPVVPNRVIFDVAPSPSIRPVACAGTRQVVDALSRTRYADTLAELASYPARHSLSSHFHDAARRARDRLQMMGYAVRLDEVDLTGGRTVNVVAEKLGAGGSAAKVALVTAHLDTHSGTTSEPDDVTAAAPGVNDNGSGSAGVLEMARVFKDQKVRHDVRFVLFGGQEQGLCGSRQYVERLSGTERSRIASVVNMDMIGVVRTDTPTVLLEGGTVSRSAMSALASAAHTYTGLRIHTSDHYGSSDHVPFLDANLPAVLTIEGSDAGTGSTDGACDTLNHIDYDYALDILRMNTAFVMREVGSGGDLLSD